MISAYRVLIRKWNRSIVLVTWIPIVIALVAVYYRDTYGRLGIELCGFDLYLLVSEVMTFMLSLSIPIVIGLPLESIIHLEAKTVLCYSNRRRLCKYQISCCIGLCIIVSLYLLMCIYIVSRAVYVTQYNWNEEGSLFWSQTRIQGPDSFPENRLVLGTYAYSFLLTCLNSLIYIFVSLSIRFRIAPLCAVIAVNIACVSAANGFFVFSKKLLMSYEQYLNASFPIEYYVYVVLVLVTLCCLSLFLFEKKDYLR